MNNISSAPSSILKSLYAVGEATRVVRLQMFLKNPNNATMLALVTQAQEALFAAQRILEQSDYTT